MDDLLSATLKRITPGHETLSLSSQEVVGDLVATTKRSESDVDGLLNSLIGSNEFLRSVPAGIILQDGEGRLLDCNLLAADLVGFTREDLIAAGAGCPGWDCLREDGSAFPDDEQPANVTLRTGEACTNVILGTNHQRQSRRWVSANTFPVELEGGAPGVISSFIEVTNQLKQDRSLKLLTEVNHVMMFARDQASCFQQLCHVLVDHGNYALAWIAVIADDEEGGVNVACAAGATEYLYEDNEGWWGSAASGKGPPAVAIKTWQTQVVHDLANDAWSELFRLRAAKYGLGSLACVPFNFGERGATLNIYDRNLFTFDGLTVTALEEIVREAEFGISHVRSVQQTEAALAETTEAINAQRATEQARAEAEESFRLAFENNMAPMLTSDLEHRVTAANEAFCEMLGRTKDELIGFDTSAYTYPDDLGLMEENQLRLTSGEVDHVRYVKRFVRKDGRVIFVEVSKSAVFDTSGQMLYFVVSQRDITEERMLTNELSHQALHDPLTGLANRALFEDRLTMAHRRVVRLGGKGAVLLVDLDDFKLVNDTFGHLMGDRLLAAVARRLEEVARSSDTVCRFGGDEFLYLVESVNSTREAEQVATRLLGVLKEPFIINGVHINQHASVGIVVWGETSSGYSEIVQEADLAMYEAKRAGKGHHVVFSPGMHGRTANRFALLNDLRHAMSVGEISMHYQPIVDLNTTGVVGFEALMRWQHPERGSVAPAMFIPLAEQSDLILELGVFALHEAAAAANRWPSPSGGGPAPFVTVNLSAHQFRDPNLVRIIETELRSSQLAPERLIIEITESVTLEYVAETLSVMEDLNRLGIGFALDDFGTGYSSLSYLALTHPKIIKIDQSFVSPAVENLRNDVLLEAIVTLGQKLDMTMLAEGIETWAQLERLQRLGCELGQGFLFAPAVTGHETARMVGRSFSP